jgi:hypothetical protein
MLTTKTSAAELYSIYVAFRDGFCIFNKGLVRVSAAEKRNVVNMMFFTYTCCSSKHNLPWHSSSLDFTRLNEPRRSTGFLKEGLSGTSYSNFVV